MTRRLLGLLGIIGGFALLSAWIVTIPTSDLLNLRLVLFTAGSMAIILVVARPDPRSGLSAIVLASGAALLANAAYLLMILMTVARPGDLRPTDFPPGFPIAGLALWSSDAAFGLAAFRVAGVNRAGALALGVGSLLAVTGIDRLGLTSAANPTIFVELSKVGLVLNGLGWVVIGLDVLLKAPPPRAEAR